MKFTQTIVISSSIARNTNESLLNSALVRSFPSRQAMEEDVWGTVGSGVTPGSCWYRHFSGFPVPWSGKREKPFTPVLLYYGRTRAPTDMAGVPTDRAWRHDYRNTIKNPEFRIRTELEPENRFSRFAQLWLNRDTYRHLQGTSRSGLT